MNQKHYMNEVDEENVDNIGKLHLFHPQNTLDAIQCLETYCVLLEILFGEESIIYENVFYMLKYMEENRCDFDRANNPAKMITVYLYSIDLEIQILLKAISEHPNKPMPSTPFHTFATKLALIRDNAVFGGYAVEVPLLFQGGHNHSGTKVFRNANEINSSDDDDTTVAKPNPKNNIKKKGKDKNKAKQQGNDKDNDSLDSSNGKTNNKAKPNNIKNGINPQMNVKWKLPAHVRVRDLIFEDENCQIRLISLEQKTIPNYVCFSGA
jgi:hypothetical protein